MCEKIIKKLLTDDIIRDAMNVPEVDLSKIENAERLGIIQIKDFSNQRDLGEKLSIYGNYQIILNDGHYIDCYCAEKELNLFINKILDI